MIARMAYRNIFRHRKRTALTLITVFVGIGLAILGDGVNGGLKWQLRDSVVRTQISHFKIYNIDFDPDNVEEDPIKYPINQEKKISEILLAQEWVKAFSPRIRFTGSITDGNNELRASFLGVYPDKENDVFKRSQSMLTGSFLAADRQAIVIGSEMASLMKLKKGDIITVMARTVTRTINAYDCEICGIIRTGNPIMDTGTIFMHREFAEEFIELQNANEYTVKCFNDSDRFLYSRLSDIESNLKSNEAMSFSWLMELKDLFNLIKLRERVFAIIVYIILFMAAAGIANTMLMAMLERKKEIGILMASGMKKGEILMLFLSEGTTIGIIGSIAGFIAGTAAVLYFQEYGIEITADGFDMSEFPFSDRIYFYYNQAQAVKYFFVGIATAAIATSYPAFKATGLNPVEAIRNR